MNRDTKSSQLEGAGLEMRLEVLESVHQTIGSPSLRSVAEAVLPAVMLESSVQLQVDTLACNCRWVNCMIP